MNDKDNSVQRKMEEMFSTLKAIARNYDEDSKEAIALEEAARSYGFLLANQQLREAYHHFVEECDKPLSEFHLDNLRRMGIDPEQDKPQA